MLRGAIWDLDGTILDSMSAWDHVGENYLRRHGYKPEPNLNEVIASMNSAGDSTTAPTKLNLNRIWMKQSPL